VQALLKTEPKDSGAFEEAARMTLAMFRLGGTTTKAQRTAQVRASIDSGLREDLAKYPLVVLQRLPRLLKEEIARRKGVSLKANQGDKKNQKVVVEQAAWLHDTFVRHGISSADADELIAGLEGLDVRTVRRYRTDYGRQRERK
jgi:hypothetical protein